MLISAGWVMIVPITNVVKMTLSVADISVEPIIGTPLIMSIIGSFIFLFVSKLGNNENSWKDIGCTCSL